VIKRSFRFGLIVGLLGGLALAVVKTLTGRDEGPGDAPAGSGSASPREPWPRLEGDPAVPARPQERLVADPDAPAAPVPDPEPVHQPVAMAPPEPVREPAAAPKAATPAKATERAPTAAPAKRAAATAGAPKKAAKPAAKKPTKKKAAPPRAWVEPDGEVCPTSHPVKAKLTSKIFHLPGGLSYGRTRPDRCYKDAAAAESDGLRPAKR
jgi:hypothetical protein